MFGTFKTFTFSKMTALLRYNPYEYTTEFQHVKSLKHVILILTTHPPKKAKA